MSVQRQSTTSLPDRISADPASPYHSTICANVLVRFDGKLITDCLEACVSEGWVERFELRNGKPVNDGDKYRTYIQRGKVELEI